MFTCDDPNNYRGITILSCFGKLFPSVINNRLVEYFDENTTIGTSWISSQAFNSGSCVYPSLYYWLLFGKEKASVLLVYWLWKSIWSCWKSVFVAKTSGLWCWRPYTDRYKGYIPKGKILCEKKEMFVQTIFYCYSGIRQGENLSPVLFAIYLNDLQEYMAERSEGLPSLGREARGLGWERED